MRIRLVSGCYAKGYRLALFDGNTGTGHRGKQQSSAHPRRPRDNAFVGPSPVTGVDFPTSSPNTASPSKNIDRTSG
jgi:hypothetical protein